MKYLKTLVSVFLILAVFSCKNKENREETVIKEFLEKQHNTTHQTVVFENEYAKVVKVELAPGEEQQMHKGNNRMIYSLNDYSIDWNENGTDLGKKDWKKGSIHFHKSGEHKAKNIGSTTAKWLVFSKTDRKLPICEDTTFYKVLSSVKPEATIVIFENDAFKVTKVNLKAGDSIPEHIGINRLLYSLNDYSIENVSYKDEDVKKEFQKGDIHWHNHCKHSIKNIGNTEADFLVIDYKK